MEENKQKKEELLRDDENVSLKSVGGKNRKTWMYVTVAVVGLALVVGGVALAVNLTNKSSSDSSVSSSVENTELGAGSATTKIGGKTVKYEAAYLVDGIEATITSGTYQSMTDDEVVFLVINGGALKIDGEVEITKSGSADFAGRGDAYSFYGTNSAIVVVGEGSSVSVNGVTIKTDVSGANAVVATDGAEAVVYNSEISTAKDGSRGLHATYGGSINADNVSIVTEGGSSATLATDRGTGTVVANNMKLSTAGAGSPLIYSTGSITVTDSSGTATGAQIAVVEGKNSITLQGCNFEANGVGNRGSVDNAGVMIYQSMSGDASVGTGSFTATDCDLTVLSSSSVYSATPFFFVTNTDATIDLTGTTVSFSPAQKFIVAMGTSEWGKSGTNGGKVSVTMTETSATNTEVKADAISTVSGV